MTEENTLSVDKFTGMVSKFTENIYIKTVSNSMMSIISFMILGSIAVLLIALPIESVSNWLAEVGLTPYIAAINNFSIGAVSIYLSFLIGKNLADNFGISDSSIPAGFASLLSFLVLTPLETVVIRESDLTVLPMQWLGTNGMITAIFVSLLASRIYVYIKRSGFTIKMPDGVPPMVSSSFESLVPIIMIGFLFGLISYFFGTTQYGDIHNFVYGVIQTPLQGIGSSIWSIALVIAFQQVLWFFGIHGTTVIAPIVDPVLLSLNVENLSAFQAGEPLPYIVNQSFRNIVAWGGSALGLVLLMLFIGKSQRYKQLGKVAVVPALFGITEPVIFGAPLVLNFKLAIPFIFNNSINLLIAYFLTNIGLVERVSGAQAIFGLPLGFHAAIGGHWTHVVLQLVIQLVISPLLWYPWFKAVDREAYEEEMAYEEELV